MLLNYVGKVVEHELVGRKPVNVSPLRFLLLLLLEFLPQLPSAVIVVGN